MTDKPGTPAVRTMRAGTGQSRGTRTAPPPGLSRIIGSRLLTLYAVTGTWVASELAVLSFRGERISEVDYFLTAELLGSWGDNSSIDGDEMFARFGLPATIA
jgi:hypothetical protein